MWTIYRLPGFDTYWAFTFDPYCTHGDIIPAGTARVESKGPTKPQMDLSYLVVKHSILLGPSSGNRCQISTRQFGMLVSTGLGRFRRELSTFDYILLCASKFDPYPEYMHLMIIRIDGSKGVLPKVFISTSDFQPPSW